MANVYKTRIDIKNTRPSFKPTFVQYDHARIEIELLDNAQYYDLSNVSRVEFTHVRPDNEVIIQPGEIVSNGDKQIIRYEYQGTEMDVLGTIKTSLAVFDEENNKVSSHTFDVVIVKDLREETFSPASPSYGLLQTMRNDIEELKLNGGGGIGLQGPKGDKGDPFTFEDFTSTQIELLRGPQGLKGADGVNGKSAYQIALDNGFVGTEAQWLLSLKGEQGLQGLEGSSANITAHEISNAPHRYGNKFEWRYNPTTTSLDLVVLP